MFFMLDDHEHITYTVENDHERISYTVEKMKNLNFYAKVIFGYCYINQTSNFWHGLTVRWLTVQYTLIALTLKA